MNCCWFKDGLWDFPISDSMGKAYFEKKANFYSTPHRSKIASPLLKCIYVFSVLIIVMGYGFGYLIIMQAEFRKVKNLTGTVRPTVKYKTEVIERIPPVEDLPYCTAYTGDNPAYSQLGCIPPNKGIYEVSRKPLAQQVFIPTHLDKREIQYCPTDSLAECETVHSFSDSKFYIEPEQLFVVGMKLQFNIVNTNSVPGTSYLNTGHLRDYKGNIIKSFPACDEEVCGDSSFKDELFLHEILAAAGVDLDSRHIQDARLNSEDTNRAQGLVIQLRMILKQTSSFDQKQVEYEIYADPRAHLDFSNREGSFRINETHIFIEENEGIRIDLICDGEYGEFSFFSFMLLLATIIAFLSFSRFFVDCLMLHIFPHCVSKDVYRLWKDGKTSKYNSREDTIRVLSSRLARVENSSIISTERSESDLELSPEILSKSRDDVYGALTISLQYNAPEMNVSMDNVTKNSSGISRDIYKQENDQIGGGRVTAMDL